ncbi:LacI family DNA-binding transcriptional regulator [Salinarimonas soli]|uniref:LacI family transcriptional regulator n=1 Tax=Salinarimonas soli TaxID=1638099 RepID=A0A5B2VB22_9HYPH|nr:LacI family DNA-binding transcriptional regulator [Salinarimonas soli]KAA2235630.1 LacI family transcriptional regulator [Salinarimonas soli]
MSATLKDVARAAQVSPATASLVLNGKGVISDETRARVLAEATRLKYGIRSRRAPRSGDARTLLFLKIAKHGHTVNRDHSTFIADYIDGMSEEAHRRGYTLEVVSHEGNSIERIAASLGQRSANGIIVLGTELSEADVRRLQATDRPTVFIDTHFDRLDANFVNMNNRDAIQLIVAHLHDRGFRRIGFVGSPVETVNFRLRLEAFIEGMRLLQLAADPDDVLMVDSTFEGAARDMADHLRRGITLPECLVCTNDIVAYGCIKALREANVRLPEDLSVVGFDNLPLAEALDPPLTTIDVSKRRIGSLAISILDDELRAAEPQPTVKALVGASLIVRGSVLGPGTRADRAHLLTA